jgi:hypothetical protein
MSEGPISQWWKSHAPQEVTTPRSASKCFIQPPKLSPYCGRRKVTTVTFVAAEATCSECLAAMAADGVRNPNVSEAGEQRG